MSRLKHTARVVCLCSLTSLVLVGCQNLNKTQKGAALGTAAGAGLGAIIGHQTGNRDLGALIGAGVGGVGGALVGNAQDAADERDAALAHAHHTNMSRQADARAVTNLDVIHMVQNNVPDRVIIATIQSRGGRFDTSPQAITSLHQSGVSEPVIQSMLR
ncbi:MAG: hypothetical protein KDA79_06340 [Planctomycetaceae bacterium]|nr:hypothetical protein [Planctomycetaceae bacterium]